MKDVLARIPDVDVPLTAAIADAIEHSVRYLASEAALASLAVDTYWPKWNSPWWHMLLLHELGEARRIPERTARALVAGVDALPLHTFPIHPGDAPPGTNLSRDISCHCALGCLAPMLAACGVDVATTLPWVEPWFSRYQMADGGLNCDDTAYLADEVASSMVGTVAPIEAMLGCSPSPSRDAFLARGHAFLAARELRLGSPSAHNADERAAAPAWLAPTFPRFYFYDALRGLAAYVRAGKVEPAAIAEVVGVLAAKFPDGVVRVERHAFAGHTTHAVVDGAWARVPTTTFPLLEAASVLGAPSTALTRQWRETRRALLDH